MSRSFKKNPIQKDFDSGKFGKKKANKAVRKSKNLPSSGSGYKKVYQSYNIHDYVVYYSKQDAILAWTKEENDDYHPLHDKYKTLERWLKEWEKMMIRK